MTEERAKRKLSGILSVDAVGYSRLMQEDEASTIRNLEDSKRLMSELIEQFKGRVVDAPGDNLLAEFSSVVDATECAVKIQEELKTKNAELPDDRRMKFRIGVNLGDVVEEADRIYGDGVNIAARIESLADAGGICISGTAYDQIGKKLPLGYEYLGEQTVKNIEKPVRVYRVLMDPEAAGKVIGEKRFLGRISRRASIAAIIILIVVAGGLAGWNLYLRQSNRVETASLDRMAFPLPDKPSIAVLPFDNLNADSMDESLADRLSESIIYTLSYLPDMLVISRNSTFIYKGKPIIIRQVAEELGVRYVLEGSVMEEKDRVRVTAQLIDATTGYHVWSGRYDRTMNDFFEMLDDITKTIAIELQVKVSRKIANLTRKTNNFDAWAYVTQAYFLVTRLGKENLFEGHRLAEKAVELDPKYGFAWAVLAAAHTLEALFGYSESPAESLKQAFEFNKKSLELDPTLACATGNRGQIYLLQGKIDEAIAIGKKAINMAPNLDTNYATLSGTMRYAGRFDESIPLMKKAMRLNPFYPAIYLYGYSTSLLMAKRYKEALDAYNELLVRAQKGEFPPFFAHVGLCAVYAELGNAEEARTHVSKITEINPDFSLEKAKKMARYRDPQHSEQWLGSLRKAGLN
ncbi:tetratricopeptide repeat protein [bacterium]|nr:tetratricopeptide repeat protein [bacterium]